MVVLVAVLAVLTAAAGFMIVNLRSRVRSLEERLKESSAKVHGWVKRNHCTDSEWLETRCWLVGEYLRKLAAHVGQGFTGWVIEL